MPARVPAQAGVASAHEQGGSQPVLMEGTLHRQQRALHRPEALRRASSWTSCTVSQDAVHHLAGTSEQPRGCDLEGLDGPVSVHRACSLETLARGAWSCVRALRLPFSAPKRASRRASLRRTR